MKEDVVTELRDMAQAQPPHAKGDIYTLLQAADEIERLRAEIAALKQLSN